MTEARERMSVFLDRGIKEMVKIVNETDKGEEANIYINSMVANLCCIAATLQLLACEKAMEDFKKDPDSEQSQAWISSTLDHVMLRIARSIAGCAKDQETFVKNQVLHSLKALEKARSETQDTEKE